MCLGRGQCENQPYSSIVYKYDLSRSERENGTSFAAEIRLYGVYDLASLHNTDPGGGYDLGTDHKGVFALGKPFGKFYSQLVDLLRTDLPRAEGLTYMVGDHIVRSTDSPGGGDILALGQHELGVGHTTVALIASDKPAVVGFSGFAT